MYDPGNLYIIGFAMMFAFAAAVLYLAKRALDRQGEAKKLSLKPIFALVSVSGVMMAMLAAKIIFMADFYQAHSMYAPS